MPTEDDSVTSCSIEETNELRRKLGLKPLIVPGSESKSEAENHSQDTEEVVERLNNVRRRRARESLIQGGSISDSIKKGESISSKGKRVTDDSEADTLDLLSWSKRMGKVSKSSINRAEKEVTYSDDEDEKKEELNGSKIKVLHKMNELDLVKGDGVTLTLKDVGVLEAEAAGVSDMDFLENAELVGMKRDRKNLEQKLRNQYGNYIPYEQDDKLNEGFLTHYDDKIKETQGLKLTSLANEDEGFFLNMNQDKKLKVFDPEENYDSMMKKKKPNVSKTELVDETDVFSSLSSKKEKLKKKPKQMNWDKIFGKEDSTKLDLDNFVPTKIEKRVNLVEDDDDDLLYTQIANNRRRVSSNIKPEDKGEVKPHIDVGDSTSDKPFEITATTEFCKVVKTPMEKISEEESEVKYKIATPTQAVKDEDPNTLSEQPLGDGISAALDYIKKRGDFIEKKAETRSSEVQLNYLDSYGNEMTPKQAFRQISWIFHGKKPSMNKQEKKIRRMERERIAVQNPVEGLPTMKALFTHQANEATPHIILTGNKNNN